MRSAGSAPKKLPPTTCWGGASPRATRAPASALDGLHQFAPLFPVGLDAVRQRGADRTQAVERRGQVRVTLGEVRSQRRERVDQRDVCVLHVLEVARGACLEDRRRVEPRRGASASASCRRRANIVTCLPRPSASFRVPTTLLHAHRCSVDLTGQRLHAERGPCRTR